MNLGLTFQRTMSLRSVELAWDTEIELGYTEVALSSSSEGGSSFPFSIPLPTDTPQCIHTIHSSLSHTLTARLYPTEDGPPALTRSVIVHTRRYSSHSHLPHVAPETRILEDPTRIEVQLPRTSFRVGEPIPVYITIPAPRRELVLDQGLRLRNVRAELVRIVKVRRQAENGVGSSSDNDPDIDPSANSENNALSADSIHDALPSPVQKQSMQPSSSSHEVDSGSSTGVYSETNIVALSGASCRLNPTRALRIRLVLHQPSESPLRSANELPLGGQYLQDPVIDCATITQMTLLHSVSFRLRVHATFMHMTSHTERVSSLSIPVVMLSPQAPLPEVEESIDEAYHKKHDRPPVRTNRPEDSDVPHYDEGRAGPSYVAGSGAPPPFEEREAPPPFFSSEAEASTSSRLPTFLESEREIYVPSNEDHPETLLPHSELAFEGEGSLFGFSVTEQFDGFTDMVGRALTPPPTLEMATRDTNVTSLANLDQTTALEALGLAIEQHEADNDVHPPPPPPPAMDDPSDPPPSIDSDFRAPGDTRTTTQSLSSHSSFVQDREPGRHSPPGNSGHENVTEGHAPPPYRVPDHDADHEQVVRPPPYIDYIVPQVQRTQ